MRGDAGLDDEPPAPADDRREPTGSRPVRAPRGQRVDERSAALVRAHIERHGWHLQTVVAEAGRIGWHHTVGFHDVFGGPDLAVFGLADHQASDLLNDLGEALASGRPLCPGERYHGFFPGVDVELRPTLPRWAPAYFGHARSWYGEDREMWQVVVADRANRLPGEPGEAASAAQVLLDRDHPAPAPLTHDHAPIDVPQGWTALAADRVGEDETGWEELVILVQAATPGRWTVTSVPFVDHLVFGDEVEAAEVDGELRIGRVVERAEVATVRVLVLERSDTTRARLGQLVEAAEADGIAWETPVRSWFFFAVPHRAFDRFMAASQRMVDDRVIARQVVRPPRAD